VTLAKGTSRHDLHSFANRLLAERVIKVEVPPYVLDVDLRNCDRSSSRQAWNLSPSQLPKRP
jgi:hypothetical protein